MEKSLRVLMLENSEADAELIKHELSRAGLEPVTKRVDSEEAFASARDPPPAAQAYSPPDRGAPHGR